MLGEALTIGISQYLDRDDVTAIIIGPEDNYDPEVVFANQDYALVYEEVVPERVAIMIYEVGKGSSFELKAIYNEAGDYFNPSRNAFIQALISLTGQVGNQSVISYVL